MKDQRWVWNPLRIMSPKLHWEIGRLEEMHETPISEEQTPNEALLIMISKLIEMTRILSGWFTVESPAKLEECERLAEEVRRAEKLVTSALVGSSSVIGQNLFRMVVRFPSRVERIGGMCENILNCCRIKSKEGIPFSDKAQAELSGLFALALDMLTNLRDCLIVPNKILLQHINSQGHELGQLVEDARFAHWNRLEAGFCSPSASSIYLEILDSFKFTNEYINKMAQGIMEIAEAAEADTAATAP
jgi:Na+/phosphate symporter